MEKLQRNVLTAEYKERPLIPEIAGLPSLEWTSSPSHASYDDAEGTLTLTAAPGVDWSNDSLGGDQQHRASALAFTAPASFSLSARVMVASPRTTFDAGVLALWVDNDHWAKLCFEYSPQGEAMVVSVVTNTHSDDSNGPVVTAPWIYLRVSRVGPAWAFHSSADGREWSFVRLFRLDTDRPVRVGFMSQAPMGDSCEARFDAIELTEEPPADLRDGS
ncbi:DUF1349 domain-containing protein [Paenarthrobacter aurescens]|uniref:DUF1349 domain-containing protein n=1 Tax=Paenarthrobacter aurescens TaxID=43663 RepID=UPI0021C15483|nr:DUF1349 domain-containing protein [Paenarthrobacter aurescens]MCT9868614.1 DUF1349 domain-containing protein [Paenarthrobacter aurescens]